MKYQDNKAVSILDNLQAGAVLKISKDATLSMVYINNSQEYTFNQPSTIKIEQNNPITTKGKMPKSRSLLVNNGQNLKIKPVNIDYMMVVMRSAKQKAKLKFITLDGTKTAEKHPTFRWKPIKGGVSYHFELIDEEGSSMLDTWVKDTTLKLPPHINLKSGNTYSWEVGVELANGKEYSNFADFAVISETEKAQMKALKPGKKATFSQRVIYASWLEQKNLQDEAKTIWKLLSKERKAQPHLSKLAKEK